MNQQHCPHCGVPISVGVMCANCADAISTDEIFDMLTFGGRVPDFVIALIPVGLGAVALIALMIVLAGSKPLIHTLD
jgi:hypothetical protein